MYVIGVTVVWAVILGSMWFLGQTATFHKFALVCGGFALGMLACALQYTCTAGDNDPCQAALLANGSSERVVNASIPTETPRAVILEHRRAVLVSLRV